MKGPSLPYTLVALAAVSAASVTANETTSWEIGAVLDAGYSSEKLELGARDKNLHLGHSDLVVRGPLGDMFTAEASIAVHTEDEKFEHHVENLWLQTTALPAGLQLRAGRFASQIGYLNEQHPHADDFTERPLLYRGFLGGHWYDDGVRLNWTAPTPFYLQLGMELFNGKELIKEVESSSHPGARTVSLKTGADINASNSWQWGLSYLNNRRQAEVEHDDDDDDGHDHHDHAHGALFSGKHLWMTDLVYKWAPDGNPKNQQVRFMLEHAQVSGIHPESGSLKHAGTSLGAVWRFHPSWEIGARTDWLKVNKPEYHEHDDEDEIEFLNARLREHAVMVAYKPNHYQTYRLQVSQQKASGSDAKDVFRHPADTAVQFQVVFGFGAHGAHSF